MGLPDLLEDLQEIDAEIEQFACVALSAWGVVTADGAEVGTRRTCDKDNFRFSLRIDLVQERQDLFDVVFGKVVALHDLGPVLTK